MAILNCACRRDCVTWASVVSIAVGILVAFLRITAVITVAPAALIAAFGIAVGFLALALLVAPRLETAEPACCKCNALTALLLGALGTAAGAVVLLAIPFAATSILGAIVTGAVAALFALTLTAAACLAKCLAGCGA